MRKSNKILRMTNLLDLKCAFFFLVFMTLAQGAFAHRLIAVAPSGQTLYYNTIGRNAQVTYPSSNAYNGYYGYTQPTGGLTIPSSVDSYYSVTSIGDYAFYGCSGLTSVTIPNSVTSIGDYAFYGCSGLTSVTIGDSVTSIGDYAFYGCSGLTSVTIPNSVTSIGDYAFYGCSGLTSITIGDSVTSIGDFAFKGCSSIASIMVSSDNNTYDSRNNCNAIIHTATNELIVGCHNTTIPNTVTAIGNDVFNGCSGLSSITIPNSVTSIGYMAFSCSGLTTVTIPNSVTSIGDFAFNGCGSLASIMVSSGNTIYDSRDNCNALIHSATNTLLAGCLNTVIPNSVTTIEANAFALCIGLDSITIPNSVTSIGYWAFDRCSGLTTVYFNADSCVQAGDESTKSVFSRCPNLSTIEFGNNVRRIPAYLCYGCDSLVSITICNSVAFIGYKAFADCSRLTTVYFNADSCIYGGSSFSSCPNISSFNFGNNVKYIPAYLCSGLTGLTTVTIPNAVTTIEQRAFSGCSGLTSVIIPDSVNSIGNSAFSGCSALTSVTIPNSTNIIGTAAFRDCDHLTNIILGSGLSTVEDSAFYGCTQVVRIKSKSANPPTAYVNTYHGLSDDVVLNVPCGAANAYENAAYWFRFDIQEELMFDFSATTGDPAQGAVAIITAPTCDNREAEIRANAYHGYHFDHWSDGNTDNPRYIVVMQDTHFVAFFASDNGEDEDVEEVVENRVKCYQQSGQIVVEGTEGNNVMVYDLYGRVLATKRNEGSLLRFDVPATGTYLIRIGDAPARRVVVIR